jgi:hypothetical protein
MIVLTTLLYEGARRERLPIYRRWLYYLKSIRNVLPLDKILFIDNASSLETLREIRGIVPNADFLSFSERLERKGQHVYPYCWRAQQAVSAMAGYYKPERMICMDPDFFPLSKACTDVLMAASNDWYALWSPEHNFPALECQVIHGSGFDKLAGYKVGDWYQNNVMERCLPVTPIKTLNGDRHGEMGITAIDPSWDYIGQLNRLDLQPIFRE